MDELRARTAAHLGVGEADIMTIGENGGRVVVILTDYRKFVIPVEELPEAAAPETADTPKAAPTKARRARAGR